jgi:hypothetical protein
MHPSVYVLRTHFMNDSVREMYNQLIKEFGKDVVFIIFDTTKQPAPVDVHHLLTIDEDLATKMNPLHAEFNLPGFAFRAESVIAKAYHDIMATGIKFKHIWVIEYDVYCTNFKTALATCDDIECDFLAKGGDDRFEVRTYHQSPGWCWWNDVFGEIRGMPLDKRQGCFFPIVRCSHAMMQAVINNLGKSTGFCEIYFPCLCIASNLTYVAIPRDAFGAFHFRPSIQYFDLIQHAVPGKLYHPLKRNEVLDIPVTKI